MDPNITPEVPEDQPHMPPDGAMPPEDRIYISVKPDCLMARESDVELSTWDECDMEPESDVDPRLFLQSRLMPVSDLEDEIVAPQPPVEAMMPEELFAPSTEEVCMMVDEADVDFSQEEGRDHYMTMPERERLRLIDVDPRTPRMYSRMIPERMVVPSEETVTKEETDALGAEKSEDSESWEDEHSIKPLGFGTALQTPSPPVYRTKAEMELQSRTDEEDKINKVIKQGKVTELRDAVQPWRLAKCKTNTLIIALKTSSKLRSLANKNLSEGQELKKLGDCTENFACALVEPFEEDGELEQKLGSSAIDTVIETSIACNDKKFLSNPVNYNFIVKKWYGRYFRLAKEKKYFLDYCWWIFLHLWSVADIFLSPVVFLMLFTVTWLKRRVQHRRRLLHVPVTEMPQENDLELGNAPIYEVIKSDEGGDGQRTGLLRGYIEYLETPYFIFVKDSLSYIMLLALHFALCVAKSTTPFSILEWVILVFFAGRIANEVYQFLLSKDEAKISQTGEEPKSWIKKQFHNYLSDSWNKIDLSTIVIYLITLIMRIITWSIGGEVIHNRTLVVAHYLYGLNASLIAIRAFGHIMETKRYMGPIQIALFKIVSDLGAIVGQFLAIILAFSLALTKIFVAEVSYNTKEKTQKSYCKSQGIVCWWQTVKQLIWSLFGMAEVSDLNSFDTVTTAIALTLYVVFLVLAVILLVNMMVALLSNTYQRVEDNSVNEWSYKKAITVMTYKSYPPIIVPMNLISLPIYIIWRKCQKEDTEARKKEREEIEANFDRVVREDLEPHYWAKYGYSYPPTGVVAFVVVHEEYLIPCISQTTDEDKTDSILNEVTGTRHITSKIAEAVFSRPLKGLPFGSNAWNAKGIAVDGCRLWYARADELGDNSHGAIYHRALTADFPKFEVLIQDFGERRFLSVGLVYRDHNHIIPPGWQSKRTKTGTVGYHVDDGRVFDPKHVFGKEIPGSMAYRGDLVGCKLLFNRQTAKGGIPVVFSLNGTDLDLGGEELEVKPDGRGEVPLYPFISMGHKGISILFKLCPSGEQAESYPSELVTCSTSPNAMERLDHLEERMERLISHIYQMTTEMNNNQTQIYSQLSSLKSNLPRR